jgi:hypothetical protein
MVRYLRAAVARAPADAVPRAALLEAYRAAGRPDLAREQYDTLARIDPGLTGALGAPPALP